jgi:hypothetical protein
MSNCVCTTCNIYCDGHVFYHIPKYTCNCVYIYGKVYHIQKCDNCNNYVYRNKYITNFKNKQYDHAYICFIKYISKNDHTHEFLHDLSYHCKYYGQFCMFNNVSIKIYEKFYTTNPFLTLFILGLLYQYGSNKSKIMAIKHYNLALSHCKIYIHYAFIFYKIASLCECVNIKIICLQSLLYALHNSIKSNLTCQNITNYNNFYMKYHNHKCKYIFCYNCFHHETFKESFNQIKYHKFTKITILLLLISKFKHTSKYFYLVHLNKNITNLIIKHMSNSINDYLQIPIELINALLL